VPCCTWINWPRLWQLVILPAVPGGILGRLAGIAAAASALLGVLGVYAILVGVRLVAIRPVPEREQKAHPAWLAPVGSSAARWRVSCQDP